MGYFVVNDYCNGINGLRAIVSTRMRDYAAMLMAYNNGAYSFNLYKHSLNRYLSFVKNAFHMKHQIYLKTSHLVYPYHYNGVALTKRLITLMWSMSLGYGFPTSINLGQGHYFTEMEITFINANRTFRTTFNVRNGLPYFMHFLRNNYSNSVGIKFSPLAINVPITLDIYDPIKDCNNNGQQEWIHFFRYIKGFIDNENSKQKTIIVKEQEYLIKYVDVCRTIIGYTCIEFTGQYDGEKFVIINGLYIESE